MIKFLKQNITGPIIHSGNSISRIYLLTSFALVPALLAYLYYLGIFILFNVAVSILLCVVLEIVYLLINKADWRFHVQDGHAILTGLIIGLISGPDTSLMFIGLACVFAILAAKHAWGGTGNYLFHPSMAGFAFAYLCLPADFADIHTQTFQWFPFLWVLGGAFLIHKKVINLHIPIAGIAGLLLCNLGYELFPIETNIANDYVIFTGYTLFCLFFISTDSSRTPISILGKWLYGLGTGMLMFILLNNTNSVASVAATVLFMNALSPLIDYFTHQTRQATP